MTTSSYTLSEVSAAIRANGLKQVRGSFLKYIDDEGNLSYVPVGACAVGQAAVNLDLVPINLMLALGTVHVLPEYIEQHIPKGYKFDKLDDVLLALNDNYNYTFDEIADWLDYFIRENGDTTLISRFNTIED